MVASSIGKKYDVNLPNKGRDTRRHVAATSHSDKSLSVYTSCNTPTRRSDKSLRVYRRILVQLFASTTGFVPSRRGRKSDHFKCVRATWREDKSCRGDKDFHKNSPVRKKQFIKVSPRRVATTCHQECSTLNWHMRPTVFLNKDTTAPRGILCSCI